MTDELSPPETNEQQGLIEKTLQPLLDARLELRAEEIALEEKVKAKKVERKRVDAVLRQGGLLESQGPGRPPKPNRESDPRAQRVAAEILILAKKKFADISFTPTQIQKERGQGNSADIRRKLERMHEKGELRLVKRDYPPGRNTGTKTNYYAVIDRS